MPIALPSPASSQSLVPHASANHSPSTLALLSLSQDITALISLSLEATASIAHDWYRSTLGLIGFGRVVPSQRERSSVKGEAGRGLAIVILGAHEATGQSLVLNLAKSGYTTFPLLPLSPTTKSNPSTTPLSSLLLRWSSTQKRLRARNPGHPGAVVPIVLDGKDEYGWSGRGEDDGTIRRFSHAGDTVRAYCRENGLCLVGIVCSTTGYALDSTNDSPKLPSSDHSDTSPTKVLIRSPTASQYCPSLPTSPRVEHTPPILSANQRMLLEAYKANILDPLSLIKELRDLLSDSASTRGLRGRIVFVNPRDFPDGILGGRGRVMGIVDAARGEVTRLLSCELGESGIDVCEVVVGPMAAKSPSGGYHLRHGSDESTESDIIRQKLITGSVASPSEEGGLIESTGEHELGSLPGKIPKSDISPPGHESNLHRGLALLSRIWAVDEALLFSSVRRAIEDRYPRYRHHAGLTPFLESVSEVVPGGGMVKALGRWVLGRLLRST